MEQTSANGSVEKKREGVSTQSKPTAIHVFDEAQQKGNEWIRAILNESGWRSGQTAYSALRATLQTLRDRLTVDEATDLAAELPSIVRGVYYEGWRPSHCPDKNIKTEEDFLNRVMQHFRSGSRFEASELVRPVFKVINQKISAGEIRQVKNCLPESIRQLWID